MLLRRAIDTLLINLKGPQVTPELILGILDSHLIKHVKTIILVIARRGSRRLHLVFLVVAGALTIRIRRSHSSSFLHACDLLLLSEFFFATRRCSESKAFNFASAM